MTSKKCFVGTEAEGPYRGLKVLFVPGGTKPMEFSAAWMLYGGQVDGVYYGAGGQRHLLTDTLKDILKLDCKMLMIETVTLQGDFIIVDMRSTTVYRKFETEHLVVWTKLEYPTFVSFLHDTLYQGDKEV